VLSGQVTVRGTSAPTEFRVHEAAMGNGAVRFRVTAHLERASFGITKKKGMVGGAVRVTIDAAGQPT
jgi:polyisoprenoid-binding protein YceI